MPHPLADARYPIRTDLRDALAVAWLELGQAGEWLSATTRLAVAREARAALTCELCVARRGALTPYALEGRHASVASLAPGWVDAVHRVVTDPGRLTESWLRGVLLEAPMTEDEFVETVAVIVRTLAMDTFALGIGLDPPAPPDAMPGAAPRRRDPRARPGPGWVATIAPEDAGESFEDFYADDAHFYIRRSLTLLPRESRKLWRCLNTLYMADPRVDELDGLERAISRAQIEFLAARVSALLGCHY